MTDDTRMTRLEAEYRDVAPLVAEKLPATFTDFLGTMNQLGPGSSGIMGVKHLLDLELQLRTLSTAQRAGRDEEQVTSPSPVGPLTRCLQHHQIEVIQVRHTKGWIGRLTANSPRFVTSIFNSTAAPLCVGPEEAEMPWARIYVAVMRRRGIAQFSANGYHRKRAPDVFFFVLIEEEKVWMLRREDLAQLEYESRTLPKEQRSYTGVTAHGKSPGSLRIWFPRGRGPEEQFFSPSKRIQDHNSSRK